MRKTFTTGAISDLPEARPRNLTEIPTTITRTRASLKEQLKTSTAKKLVSSASTSSLTSVATRQQPRSATARPPRAGDGEGPDKGHLLEARVKELQAEADVKDNEIHNLRTELQRYGERRKNSPPAAGSSAAGSLTSDSSPDSSPEHGHVQVADVLALVTELREKNAKFQKELAALREENQTLKEKLLGLEASPALNGLPASDPTASPPGANSPPSVGSPHKSSVSSNADMKDLTPSPDSSEFEKIPSNSTSACSSIASEATGAAGTAVSVQRLTDRISKMEESHHSTAEELQATLQELADQQQVVHELTAENERLAQDKRLLQASLQQQRERMDLAAQKNEALAGRLQEQAQAQARREAEEEEELASGRQQAPRLAELEQRYGELVESSRFEREKLVDIQQQLTGSLRALEQEHQEAQGQARGLGEERDDLRARLERATEAEARAAAAAEERRASGEGLRLENGRLKAQVDIERQKVTELKAVRRASDGGAEPEAALKAAHAERDRPEVELSELRQQLLQAQAETEHAQAAISKTSREREFFYED
ncbi:hypothetical protein CRUP_020956 [Coryphaenoides rupestris]|nr:hypothetical protein CRUP_020956 [Coryphaenoides rupestris]